MPQGLLFPHDAETTKSGPKLPVVLSYGMGVDSTALLMRWLLDPKSRDFPLEDLVALTAMTGDEFEDTRRLVETHMLPLLREFRIRYVQIARSGPLQGDGVTVLDDSREPTKLYLDGVFRLSQELLSIGTVPQVATGQRRCTHHFKGFPLTHWTDREYDVRPIRHVLGYNADETKRVARSEGYSTETRQSEYPLVAWGWGREHCEGYVGQIAGETWRKSCCTFCPFAGGKFDILERYRQFPGDAAEALFLELISTAFNPSMLLYGRKSLRLVLDTDGNREAFRLLEERLNAVPWAIYRVRRIVWAKGRADRKTEKLCEGERAKVVAELRKQGAMDDWCIPRLCLLRRQNVYPTREEMLVAAPAVVEDKCRPSFEVNWQKLTEGTTLFDSPTAGSPGTGETSS